MNVIRQMKDEQITRAIKIHDGLMDWCEKFDKGYNPIPCVTIAGFYLGLSIGDIQIWDSENGYHDEMEHSDGLSFDDAVKCYKNLISQLSGYKE